MLIIYKDLFLRCTLKVAPCLVDWGWLSYNLTIFFGLAFSQFYSKRVKYPINVVTGISEQSAYCFLSSCWHFHNTNWQTKGISIFICMRCLRLVHIGMRNRTSVRTYINIPYYKQPTQSLGCLLSWNRECFRLGFWPHLDWLRRENETAAFWHPV